MTTLHLGQVIGLGMAATGLAALTDTTGGLVAAIAAAGLLAVGADRRAAGLATLAIVSPAVVALAAAGVGAGTFERAGLVGDRLSWSGPIVGVMAAMVLGIVATRRRNNGLMLMAAGAPVIGLITGLASVDGSIVAWLTVPALVVIAAELGWWMLPDDRFRRHVAMGVDGLAGTLAVIAVAAPQLATTDPSDGLIRFPWAVPVALGTLALALAILRVRPDGDTAADLFVAGAASGVIATVVAFDVTGAAIAALAVATVPAAAFLSRRLHPLAIYVPAAWALTAIIDLEPAASTGRFATGAVLLVALVGVVLVARTRLAANLHWIGWFELSAVASIGATTAIAFVPAHAPAAVVALGAVISMSVMLIERRLVSWGALMIGTIGVVAADAATQGGTVDPTYWIGWAVATVAMATTWWFTRSRIASYGAAAAGVIAAACSMAAVPLDAEQFVVLAMIGVAFSTGLAVTFPRRSPLDAATIAAGVVLLSTTAFEIHPGWASASWIVIGAQLTAYGFALRQPIVAIAGGAVTAVAAGSRWFTTGLHDWFPRRSRRQASRSATSGLRPLRRWRSSWASSCGDAST